MPFSAISRSTHGGMPDLPAASANLSGTPAMCQRAPPRDMGQRPPLGSLATLAPRGATPAASIALPPHLREPTEGLTAMGAPTFPFPSAGKSGTGSPRRTLPRAAGRHLGADVAAASSNPMGRVMDQSYSRTAPRSPPRQPSDTGTRGGIKMDDPSVSIIRAVRTLLQPLLNSRTTTPRWSSIFLGMETGEGTEADPR